jgi:hypothetical protein
MIGARCTHKLFGHIGKITSELSATIEFPEQWGIYWYAAKDGVEHAIHTNRGILYHWQNKTDIEIMKALEFSLTDGKFYPPEDFPLTHMSLNAFTNRTNRSNGQTMFLFELCDNDFNKLCKLETQIKNCFYFGCPADKDELENVLNMTPKTDKWSF